jgi:hypothetical protein
MGYCQQRSAMVPEECWLFMVQVSEAFACGCSF